MEFYSFRVLTIWRQGIFFYILFKLRVGSFILSKSHSVTSSSIDFFGIMDTNFIHLWLALDDFNKKRYGHLTSRNHKHKSCTVYEGIQYTNLPFTSTHFSDDHDQAVLMCLLRGLHHYIISTAVLSCLTFLGLNSVLIFTFSAFLFFFSIKRTTLFKFRTLCCHSAHLSIFPSTSLYF